MPATGVSIPGCHFVDCRLTTLYGSVSISSSSQFAVQHLALPLLVVGLHRVELGHHLGGEQLQRLADVLVACCARPG